MDQVLLKEWTFEVKEDPDKFIVQKLGLGCHRYRLDTSNRVRVSAVKSRAPSWRENIDGCTLLLCFEVVSGQKQW
jgi:hypothetical protein